MNCYKISLSFWAQSLNQILSTTPPFVINKNKQRKVKKNIKKWNEMTLNKLNIFKKNLYKLTKQEKQKQKYRSKDKNKRVAPKA